MHLQGQPYKIVSTDGQPIESPSVIQDQPFTIAPEERYDIEFTESNAANLHHAAAGMVTELLYQGYPRFVPD